MSTTPSEPSSPQAATSSESTLSSFDLETHVLQRYTGEALIQRLLWIAHHDPALAPTALPAAVTAARQQNNVMRYKEILQQSNNAATATATTLAPLMDTHWLQEAEQQHRHQLGLLTSRLQTAQAHLHKEAVRTSYTVLAQFHAASGDWSSAWHTIHRAKDYCTTRRQTAQTSLLILYCALHGKNYAAVHDYVPRVEHTVDLRNTTTTSNTSSHNNNNNTDGAVFLRIKNRVQIAAGLERLAAGSLTTAAQKFAAAALMSMVSSVVGADSHNHGTTTDDDTTNNMDDWDRTVLAPEDVALYATVLTLSHGSRATALQLIEHADGVLERVPVLRTVLQLFHRRAAYREAWHLLQQYAWPILQHDPYFGQAYYCSSSSDANATVMMTSSSSSDGNNTAELLPLPPTTILEAVQQAIRHKAIRQFWKPYHNCPLTAMAEQLGPGLVGGPQTLEATVVHLLENRRRGRGDDGSVADLIFPEDTRLDWRTRTLVRDSGGRRSCGGPSDDPERLRETTHKLQTTSTRVLDDTYAMMVRLACLEQDLIVQDQNASAGKGRGRGGWNSGTTGGGARQGMAGSALDPTVGASSDEDYDDNNNNESNDSDAHMFDAIQGDGMNPEDLY